VDRLGSIAWIAQARPTHPTMLSQAFLDESGGLDHDSFFLGGLVGPVEMWKDFSEDWQAVLDQEPALPAFHMVKCEGLKGGFEVLNEITRHERLSQLVDVLAEHEPQAVAVKVGIENWKRRTPRGSTKKQNKAHWRYPYAFAAENLVGTITKLQDATGRCLGRIDIVFDWME
jgi:hypothetical protein